MANTFKVKTNAAMSGSANSPDVLYTVPANKRAVVLGLILANVHTSQVTVSVQLVSTTSDVETNQTVYLLRKAPIPSGSSLEILSGNKVIVQAGDIIKVECDTAAKIDATLSIMEID